MIGPSFLLYSSSDSLENTSVPIPSTAHAARKSTVFEVFDLGFIWRTKLVIAVGKY